MARLDEIAEGIAAVLRRSAAPEPLHLDLWGHSPVDTTVLVRSVIDACQRTAAPLALVRVSNDMGARLWNSLETPGAYEGTAIELDDALGKRLKFYRFSETRSPAEELN